MMEAGQADVPVHAAMKLLHVFGILQDECLGFQAYGIQVVDGVHLMLVISFPSGDYGFASRRENAPTGDNTTARVEVSFQEGGRFRDQDPHPDALQCGREVGSPVRSTLAMPVQVKGGT